MRSRFLKFGINKVEQYFSVVNDTKMRFFGVKQCLNEIILVLNNALMRFFGVKQCFNEIFWC